ncbi:carbon-nitrogen hydrolase family protein [Paenibacillus agaridevorans]|uniref:Carbon-nitrogen hydrolase family protein n=1 Tax=Paenibacillus agaridevorans TaxID=171404 RepID=A0A2R5EWF8_9BACL|nr:carbon-nitrogen hydrolase family protein [Paenibacillus agaridevorans]GBG11036.1 carbon-nitrogen hydrolase family protein [Paenibacillus agaridevorans]
MARYVKISTCNFNYCAIVPEQGIESAIQAVTAFLENKIQQVLPDQPDLIVLPECCDMPAGYGGERLKAYYRQRADRILDSLSAIAKRNRCYIAYPSIRYLDDGTWRNSVRLIDREGKVTGTYNKNHPVIVEMEQDGIVCGSEAPIFECDFGRVAIAICFDLNFAPLRERYANEQPDLILFPSMFHGGFMQQYWAYACRSYFVGAIAGNLPSAILSPVGQLLHSTSSYYDYVTGTVNLDAVVVHLDLNRPRLEKMKQKYGSKAKIMDPGYVGSVLVSSETTEFTANDLVEEFELEKLDNYFSRSLAYHRNT